MYFPEADDFDEVVGTSDLDKYLRVKAWVQEAGQMLILNVKKQMPSGDRDWPAIVSHPT